MQVIDLLLPVAGAAKEAAALAPAAKDSELLRWIFQGSFAVLAVAFILAAIHVIRGPSVPDRVIALDVMGNLCAALIALFAIFTGRPILLAIAMVIALIMFLGTVAFSIYIERRARPC